MSAAEARRRARSDDDDDYDFDVTVDQYDARCVAIAAASRLPLSHVSQAIAAAETILEWLLAAGDD